MEAIKLIRILNDFFNDEFRFAGSDMSLSMWAVNVKEEKDNYIVEVTVPVLQKEDFYLK